MSTLPVITDDRLTLIEFTDGGPDAMGRRQNLWTASADAVRRAHLIRREYEKRVLLDACHRALDAIPDGSLTDEDDRWLAQTYIAWATAWEALEAHRKAAV